MNKTYKIWVQIEEHQHNNDGSTSGLPDPENVTEPEPFYETEDLDRAKEVMAHLILFVSAMTGQTL